MKIINITDLTSKPSIVSVMARIKNKDERFELQPGESVYSNGIFSELFNKSLRVQKQKGLINVVDENDLEQMARDEQEELNLIAEKEKELEQIKKEDEIKKSNEKNAFDNSELLEETRPHHPDVIIINKKEIDYSANILPEPEQEENKKKKGFFRKKD